MTKQEKVFDILNKFEFLQGQRAGRELWNNKPKEVQDKDISDFIKDINYIRSYLQDSVVLSREEYEDYKKHVDNCVEEYHRGQHEAEVYYKNIQIPRERKETAEKILFKFESAFAYYDNEDMFSKKAIFECLEEIVKSLGVEIKEYEK